MNIDTMLIILIVILSIALAVGFYKLIQENPRLLEGIENYRWDKHVEVFQPKRNFSILEDPEDE